MHMQLVTGAHSVFNLKAHIVFVVAYRRKAISTRILKQLIVIFSEVCLRNRAQLSDSMSIGFDMQTQGNFLSENSSQVSSRDKTYAMG